MPINGKPEIIEKNIYLIESKPKWYFWLAMKVANLAMRFSMWIYEWAAAKVKITRSGLGDAESKEGS